MLISGGKVVLPDRVLDDGAVVIDDATGRIEAVGPRSQLMNSGLGSQHSALSTHRSALIAPGFVDVHNHGAWDSDFMDGTREAFEVVCAFNALHGTTSLLATSTSAETGVILRMLELTREAMARPPQGSRVLGAHLEGPWLNPAMKGCHLERHCRPPSPDERRAVLAFAPAIRRVTLSPEVAGGIETTRELAAAGIVVSAGHSAMTYDEMMPAIEAGVRHVTHIFCAMSTTVRKGPWRHPGLLETTLVDDRLTTEMIADGKHLPAALMQLAWRCKAADRLCLVSDAMRGAGMPAGGRSTFGPRDGTEVVIADGVAMLTDMSAFASSVTPLEEMVRNVVEMVGVPLHEAVRMASLTPARIVGVADRKGSLEPGKDADLCILDADLRVTQTIIGGKILDRERLAHLAQKRSCLTPST
jgi:N-acetylglucosamine-6-phosphate deacetylase